MTIFLLILYSFCKEDTINIITNVICIDFGTTYSRVSTYGDNGQIHIIPNEEGFLHTPSIVSFKGDEIFVGESAKYQKETNPTNTIFSIKRLLGLRYSDEKIQKYIKQFPYKIIDKDDHPYIQVDYKNETRLFSPEEISSIIFSKMKQIAENYLKLPVKYAVISVPSYFNMAQRQAVIDSATIAGLNVIGCVSDSISIVNYKQNNKESKKKVLLLDFGGGKIDLSVVDTGSEVYIPISVIGDTNIGGDDFDYSIVEYLIKRYYYKTSKNISNNIKLISKLKTEAEKAKIALTSHDKYTIEIEDFNDDDDFIETLTRLKFLELNEKIFNKILNLLQIVIKNSGLTKSEIDDFVLVGSSSRIPEIQRILSDFFNIKQSAKNINAEVAVSYGICGKAIQISDDEYDFQSIYLDRIPLTIGIEINGTKMLPIIPKYSSYPYSKSILCTTFKDYQTYFEVKIYEGENTLTKNNLFIDSFNLTGIKLLPKKAPVIEVRIEIDDNRRLFVSAEEKISKTKKSLDIIRYNQLLSNYQLERATNNMKLIKEENEMIKKAIMSKNNLENYLFEIQNKIKNNSFDHLSSENKEKIMQLLTQSFNWLNKHTKEEKRAFDKKYNEIQKCFESLIKEHSQNDL